VIRRALAAGGVAALAIGSLALGRVARRGALRVMHAPRTLADEGDLGPALDALGGEVVRLRSRDGVRLAARWLEVDATAAAGDGAPWQADPREAILLLHGYSGSVAPDLVEFGPFLRRTAGVLGLDFGGHGGSDGAPTTFGLRETEDVAGALAWLGERGIRQVAFFGTSMGGITAIAATAVLGDGSLAAADVLPDAPATVQDAPRPRIVGIVAEAVAPELRVVVASRLPGPAAGTLADRILDAVTREVGADPRLLDPRAAPARGPAGAPHPRRGRPDGPAGSGAAARGSRRPGPRAPGRPRRRSQPGPCDRPRIVRAHGRGVPADRLRRGPRGRRARLIASGPSGVPPADGTTGG
jgi:hypothetical protein